MTWQPISKDALEREIENQLRDLSVDELAYFEKIRVPLHRVAIHRRDVTEEVFIVAKFEGRIVFYDDVEDGFEIAVLNSEGVIEEYGCSQFSLQHIVNQLCK